MKSRYPVSRHRAILGLLILTAFAPAAAQAQRAQGSFQRTVTVSSPADVEVVTGAGHIDVRQGSGGKVAISAEIKAQDGWGGRRPRLAPEERVRQIEANPPVEQQGNTVRIGHIADDDLRENISISYVVEVPPGTAVRSKTGSGSQEIAVDGTVEAHSGSGSLRVRRGAQLRASTGSGSITVETIDGAFHASTGSGSIQVGSAGGPITAKTGSGSIEITQRGSGTVDVSSSSGTVRIRGVRGALDASTSSGSLDVQGEMSGAWQLSTSSGRVHIDLPPGQRFELDANSTSGHIDVDFPITITGRIDKRSVRGAVDGGGPLLHVRTSSGGISIQ